ncbi:MAG: UDP-N-acetylmuramoyl-tripeptide--D-alanyl-D-alanine ligase [Coriobacteriia bacterium]|nr:UDP-N-acetylmuramoyl-tripeptide--D-alanyl-D-alanine ligase [Coriobacteriia bacterium]
MLRMTAAEIARATGGRVCAGSADAEADACVIDSRAASPGSVFVAFTGAHGDGHDYLEDVARAGAAIALVTKPVPAPASGSLTLIQVDDACQALQDLARFQRSRLCIPVIGVTGSTGKTSTKELLKAALNTGLKTVATEANHNNELGVPLTLLSADETTEALIVEMGMRAAGEIALLAEIARPQIGVITTISDAHLERLGSRENIARAKAELFEALPAGTDGLAVFQAGVPFERLLRSATSARICTVGRAPVKADLVASDLCLDSQACAHARVTFPDGRTLPLDLSVSGAHNIDNALLALAVGLHLGLDAEAMTAALQAVTPTGLRLKSVDVPKRGITLIADAYNANPESMAAALRTLASLQPSRAGGRRIAVLGDMLELGAASAEAHRAVLTLARELGLECLFVFGSQFGAVCSPEVAYDDMVVLTQSLCSFVRPGDIVLVKGSRVMRMERVIEALQAEN